MRWLKNLFSRRRVYNDLSAEIREHLKEKVDELVATGTPKREARGAARREFGNLTQLEERGPEVWQWASLEDLFQDVRRSLRLMRKNLPRFNQIFSELLLNHADEPAAQARANFFDSFIPAI
jgi:hypothetical protein